MVVVASLTVALLPFRFTVSDVLPVIVTLSPVTILTVSAPPCTVIVDAVDVTDTVPFDAVTVVPEPAMLTMSPLAPVILFVLPFTAKLALTPPISISPVPLTMSPVP